MKIKLQRKQIIVGALVVAASGAFYYCLRCGLKSMTVKKGGNMELAVRKLAGGLKLETEEDETTLTVKL